MHQIACKNLSILRLLTKGGLFKVTGMKTLQFFLLIPVLVIIFLLSACSSVGKPVEKLANAETAVMQARQSNAITYAPLELKLAEDKLKQAKDLINEDEYEKAVLLLDEAYMDARLAYERAQSIQAKNQAKELNESINALRQEIERMNKRE
jgi:hypothetical protein